LLVAVASVRYSIIDLFIDLLRVIGFVISRTDLVIGFVPSGVDNSVVFTGFPTMGVALAIVPKVFKIKRYASYQLKKIDSPKR